MKTNKGNYYSSSDKLEFVLLNIPDIENLAKIGVVRKKKKCHKCKKFIKNGQGLIMLTPYRFIHLSCSSLDVEKLKK